VIDASALTSALQKVVLDLEDDLRARVESDTELRGRWVVEHQQAITRQRTGSAWVAWRDDRVTQAAVAWVLASVFVRFCEDNALVAPVWIAGPEHRRQEALDAQLAFFRAHPLDTDREWLQQAIDHLAALPATAELVGAHSALNLVTPSGDAVTKLLTFWRQKTDTGWLVFDFTDSGLDTRFLGDLYQDLSAYAKATFALLQTPVFVEEFILDRTLEPALDERPLEGFRMIDPTCGSGHFLLGAFDRLLDRWHKHAPAMEKQALVQQALDAIHGVDLNPFAVAIARFRLTVAAMGACGLRSLEAAPAFRFHLAVGDSLLHGPGQQTMHGDADLAGFTYETEDLHVLQTILADGRYDVVVGNPPYITVKDPQLNAAYRARYATCKGKYALTVPFMERFFGLARRSEPAGWIGEIASNSFMKREFGTKLIEDFLVRQDLRLVVDTAGAYIPGHGTPTVILVGRSAAPSSKTLRAVLGVRGEPGRPEDPAQAVVWRAIADNVDTPGVDTGWVSVVELDRQALARHPWSLTGGGAAALRNIIERGAGCRLADRIAEAGFSDITGEDEVFLLPRHSPVGRDDGATAIPFVEGDLVRDWQADSRVAALFPTTWDGSPRPMSPREKRHLWPYRSNLRRRMYFGKLPEQRGLRWFDHAIFQPGKHASGRLLVHAFVATHNHFALSEGGQLFNKTAPVIRLPVGSSEEAHLELLGVLNSSVVCFWLKENCQAKPMIDEPWAMRYEFNGTNVVEVPLPDDLPLARTTALSSHAARQRANQPAAVVTSPLLDASQLANAKRVHDDAQGQVRAHQEELDWEVYRLYSIIDDDLTYEGVDLPGLALGERAFEIDLARKADAGEGETSWFSRHDAKAITELPSHWPPAYRDVVQRRLDRIASDPSIELLERPEHKRRWASESWDKRQERALRGWLLDRLEDQRFWFDGQARPNPRSVAQLADEVARDVDLVSVLALWEGRRDVPVTESLLRLLAEEAVPYLAAYRYKDSGLRKREAWEQTWALQRREDAGEQVGPIPVPPKYASADFRKESYWQARGKLDVPKERFVLFPDAGRDTDPTPLLGWAGWDHAQQALALSLVIGAREADGWGDERLVPLVAGLAELQPWVEQWHAEVDPTYGVSLGAFCREQLNARMTQVGKTLDELTAWRPEPASRGRRPRAT
jgi:hypothetical protein